MHIDFLSKCLIHRNVTKESIPFLRSSSIGKEANSSPKIINDDSLRA